jgi:hypothetical protein
MTVSARDDQAMFFSGFDDGLTLFARLVLPVAV